MSQDPWGFNQPQQPQYQQPPQPQYAPAPAYPAPAFQQAPQQFQAPAQGFAPQQFGFPQQAPPQVFQPPLPPGSIDAFMGQPKTGRPNAISWKNAPDGTSLVGIVASTPSNSDVVPDTDPQTKSVKQFRDGSIKYVLVLTLQLGQSSQNYPDGLASLYCRGDMWDKMHAAFTAIGRDRGLPQVGDRVKITLLERRQGRGSIPKSIFDVQVQAGDGQVPAIPAPAPQQAPAFAAPQQFQQPGFQGAPQPDPAQQFQQGAGQPAPQQVPQQAPQQFAQPAPAPIPPAPQQSPQAAPAQPQAPAQQMASAPALSDAQAQMLSNFTGAVQQ